MDLKISGNMPYKRYFTDRKKQQSDNKESKSSPFASSAARVRGRISSYSHKPSRSLSMKSTRHYSVFDQWIIQIDNCLQTIGGNQNAERPYPADSLAEPSLSCAERQQSAGLMRVNHCGEVCAQALYNAQALVARNPKVRDTLAACGKEETDHLAWCHQRLNELNSHRSYLNVIWYWNSFVIGLSAGIAGDKWSLGFVEETESQVGKHLQGHLDRLAKHDDKSRAVIQQMEIDEAKHANKAKQEGAAELPTPIKKLMALHAKVMTSLAYWV